MVKATAQDITLSVRSSTRRICEITGIAKFELVHVRNQVSQDHRVENACVQTSQESAIGQTHSIFRAYSGAVINRRVSHETPLGYTSLAP
jgi:hypothetical protein